MNDLKKRFMQERLSKEQKQKIIDNANQPTKRFHTVYVVLPIFIVLACLFLMLLGEPTVNLTTAATPFNFSWQFSHVINIILLIILYKFLNKKLPKMAEVFTVTLIGYIILAAIIGDNSPFKEIVTILLALFIVWQGIIRSKTSDGSNIKNKHLLYIAPIALGISFFMYMAIDPIDKLEANMLIFGFPIQNRAGYLWFSCIGLFLMTGGMAGILSNLTRGRLRVFLVIMISYFTLPQVLTSLYQETFAEGVKAIHYKDDGSCHYYEESENELYFNCVFTLQNRSNDNVTFELFFFEPQLFETEVTTLDFFNLAGPFVYTLGKNETSQIMIEEVIDVTNIESQPYAGEIHHGVHFRLMDEENVVYK